MRCGLVSHDKPRKLILVLLNVGNDALEVLKHKLFQYHGADVMPKAPLMRLLGIRELDRDTVDELIDRIEVGESAIVDGKRVRDIRIFYRFIGTA